jgi:predicted transcriptional regulator
MGRKKKEGNGTLTPTELKIMRAIWALGEATVHQVLETLKGQDDYAYTTVSTIVRTLEQKGFVHGRKDGRGHVYAPLMSKEDYQVVAIDDMVQGPFDGTPMALIRGLLGNAKLSKNDIDELKKLIRDRE